MRIRLVTPAPLRSRAGNRTTAMRWRAILCSLGHRVDVSTAYNAQDADLMIALHAWRSANAATAFAERFPDRPLLVALTGTDIYRYIHTHPRQTLRSILLADQLIGLHELVAEALPHDQRAKVRVIYQSAKPVGIRQPYRRFFHVSVIGHLRDEKDPLRPAMAARLLAADSRVRIHQYGKAMDQNWADQATSEMQKNPGYRWHGEIPKRRLRQVYRRTHLLVLPSRMEGGANVISEAVVAGVPVIASNIPGSIGLLGANYPGYFPMADERSLAILLQRAESDRDFYVLLEEHCHALRDRFSPAHETHAWATLIEQLDPMLHHRTNQSP